MNARTIVTLALKVVALTIILFICFTVASVVSGVATPPSGAEPSPAGAGSALSSLLVVSLLETAVLSYIILRSRWSGWKLVGSVFLAFYGLSTVVVQIESLVFLPHQLPPGMVPKLFVMWVIVAGLFSPLAVLILGKMRREARPQAPNLRLVMPLAEWVWKLAAIAVVYVILYFTFGYFVAWKNPAVQAYYGGTDPGSFLLHMSNVLRDTPGLLPLQVWRALLWTAFALPVIRMMKGRLLEAGLAVALLYVVLGSAQLLLPNPYMPQAVAQTHLIEIASSNFIFGWLVAWLMDRHHASLWDLFWWSERTG